MTAAECFYKILWIRQVFERQCCELQANCPSLRAPIQSLDILLFQHDLHGLTEEMTGFFFCKAQVTGADLNHLSAGS